MSGGLRGGCTSRWWKSKVSEAASRVDQDDSGDDDEEDNTWREQSELAHPPPRSSDVGAGPSGHGSSSWTVVDINDPRCKEVLKKLDAAKEAEDKAYAIQREQAANRVAKKADRTEARVGARTRQATEARVEVRTRQATAASAECSAGRLHHLPPSPPPSPAGEEALTSGDEEVRAPICPALSTRHLPRAPTPATALHAFLRRHAFGEARARVALVQVSETSFNEDGARTLLHAFDGNLTGMLLADRAGSGKTVTTLLFLQQLAQAGKLSAQRPCLIVVPPNLRAQWRDEVRRWTPALKARAACPCVFVPPLGRTPPRLEPQTSGWLAHVKAFEQEHVHVNCRSRASLATGRPPLNLKCI